MSRYAQAAWEFKTAKFRVALEILPEEMDPADSFQFEEDIEAVRSGAVEWFCACVVVYGVDGEELGRDVLGGCAYNSIKEFYASHRDADPMNRNSSIMRQARGDNASICHYFPDMVAQAIDAARSALDRRCKAYCS